MEVIFIKKLDEDFYTRDTITVAKELLGKYIVNILNGKRLSCKITDVEAYIGPDDKACHAYKNKKTERTKALFLKGGNSYVYLIYGMYYCMNVVTENAEIPAAVLIRGGIPFEGIDYISKLRYGFPLKELSKKQKKNMLNGPGKLCKGMGIDKNFNKVSLISDNFYIYCNENEQIPEIKCGKRINIDYAQEYKDKLWRFYTEEEFK